METETIYPLDFDSCHFVQRMKTNQGQINPSFSTTCQCTWRILWAISPTILWDKFSEVFQEIVKRLVVLIQTLRITDESDGLMVGSPPCWHDPSGVSNPP